MNNSLKDLANKLSSNFRVANKQSRDVMKEHFKQILRMIGQIIHKGNIIINEYQFNLLVHLFNLCNIIHYVPSGFLKLIAEMSSFTSVEITGMFSELKNQKSTEFLSLYYKTVSMIINNKNIKKDKKKLFEAIVSQKLNESTVQWLISLFTSPIVELDEKTKLLLKAITQTEFDFFEAFAVNFKKTLSQLISSSNNNNNNWMNKYVFKIIEKCLIKLPNIEREFLFNLSKICHSIIDLFIAKKNHKIKKLYRLCMRLMYIIYDRRNEKISKVLKFFEMKFEPILSMELKDDFIVDILKDFVEVNCTILNRKEDLNEFYKFFYSCCYKTENKKMNDDYLDCIEDIMKYESRIKSSENSGVAFIKQLLNDFNSCNLKQNSISIRLICKILTNCETEMKLTILDEITFSNFSFFSHENNVPFLENLIKAIASKITNETYSYYAKYLDLLFIHSLNEKYEIDNFFNFLECVNYDEEKIFFLCLNFCHRYFVYLQDNSKFENKDYIGHTVKFLELLAIKSMNIQSYNKSCFQDILNTFAYLLIYRSMNIEPNNNLHSKFMLPLEDNDKTKFNLYLLLFANNMPEMIFNKNTSMTSPIKIEISPVLYEKISNNKKLLSNEFEDFGEYKDPTIVNTIFLSCIYIQFISKFFILNTLVNYADEWRKVYNFITAPQYRVKPEMLRNEKISIVSLLSYLTDNLFLYNEKNKEFLTKMYNKFFDKYFNIIKKTHNTLFKQKLISYDLKQLLNFACYYHSSLRSRAVTMIKTYAKYFPFILNEYDIFEYYINILGILISLSVKNYNYFINEIKIENFSTLDLPPEKKTINQIFSDLNKIVEKCLQKSHMINNDNIIFNVANYMNQYSSNSNTEWMNYSVNLLQKIYNNIKKIEIPPMLKTSAYLDPEKFQNYLKTHVKKNFDKYTSLGSINDIYSPSDYAKTTKLQQRNKYIGVVEGKINNLKTEFGYSFDQCFYIFKNETAQKLRKCFSKEKDINSLTKSISPLLIEVTSFIVCAADDSFKTSFDKSIIYDELINILTSIPLVLNNAGIMETAKFCWEWILYLEKNKIQLILKNISTSLTKNKSNKLHLIEEYKKPKSAIFDLENNLESSIKNAKEAYFAKILPFYEENNTKVVIESHTNNNKVNVSVINEKLNYECKNVTYTDYITGQITLLKFLKECMNEFCKCDMEKLQLVFTIIKHYVDLKINSMLYRTPLYIYLHFFILNIGLELCDIMESRIDLYELDKNEITEFKVLLLLFGLKYFKFDKQRRRIESKFFLSEIEQTLINCEEILSKETKIKFNIDKKSKNHKRKSNLEKVYSFINTIGGTSAVDYENFMYLLVFLIDSEMNSLIYWNNPSTSHKSSINYNEDKIKKIIECAFKFNDNLCIKLIQRFPWIKKKYPNMLKNFEKFVNNNRSKFYHQPLALPILVDSIVNSGNTDSLKSLSIINDLIFWKFPSLNYAFKYISLSYTTMYGLHKYCTYMMEHAVTKAIIFYLPQLIQSLRTDTNYEVVKFILERCKKSSMIAHQFLWALEVEEVMAPKTKKRYLPKGYVQVISSEEMSKILRLKILKSFNVIQRKFWFDENEIFSSINEVSGCFLHTEGEYANLSLKWTKEQKTDFVRKELAKITTNIQPYIYLPTNPNYKILSILPETAVTLQSAKKVPFIVSFDAVEYEGPDKESLINNLDITSFVQSEIGSLKNFNIIGGNNFSIKSRLGSNYGINEGKKNNYKSNVSITDIILDEEVDVNEKIVENEKSQAIYVPTFEPRALKVKKEYGEEEEKVIGRNSVTLGMRRGFEERKNEDINTSAKKHRNSEMKETKTMNLLNTNFSDDNSDNVLNQDEKGKINLLDSCTTSEISSDDFDDVDKKLATLEIYDEDSANPQNTQKNINTAMTSKLINMSCIFKVGDDLRQDSLALQVIQIFQEIFNENNLNLYTFPYQTISTISPKYRDLGGFIEVVKDCDSRDQIGKTYDTNLFDYYLCSFGQEDSNEFREARKNLIISLAAYGIISYILQIKDRHNGNILIDKYGHLIHIDFGFIFDISPGGNLKFERAAFKLTKEMISIMENSDSEAYATFVDLTVRAFLACRDYMEMLLDPVVLMFSSGLDCFRENSIKNFIDRFRLDLNEEEAANYMRGLIKTAEDNWRTNFYDFIQKKQNNISY